MEAIVMSKYFIKKEPNSHDCNDDFTVDFILDLYPEEFSEFFVTEHVDFRGEH